MYKIPLLKFLSKSNQPAAVQQQMKCSTINTDWRYYLKIYFSKYLSRIIRTPYVTLHCVICPLVFAHLRTSKNCHPAQQKQFWNKSTCICRYLRLALTSKWNWFATQPEHSSAHSTKKCLAFKLFKESLALRLRFLLFCVCSNVFTCNLKSITINMFFF